MQLTSHKGFHAPFCIIKTDKNKIILHIVAETETTVTVKNCNGLMWDKDKADVAICGPTGHNPRGGNITNGNAYFYGPYEGYLNRPCFYAYKGIHKICPEMSYTQKDIMKLKKSGAGKRKGNPANTSNAKIVAIKSDLLNAIVRMILPRLGHPNIEAITLGILNNFEMPNIEKEALKIMVLDTAHKIATANN